MALPSDVIGGGLSRSSGRWSLKLPNDWTVWHHNERSGLVSGEAGTVGTIGLFGCAASTAVADIARHKCGEDDPPRFSLCSIIVCVMRSGMWRRHRVYLVRCGIFLKFLNAAFKHRCHELGCKSNDCGSAQNTAEIRRAG